MSSLANPPPAGESGSSSSKTKRFKPGKALKRISATFGFGGGAKGGAGEVTDLSENAATTSGCPPLSEGEGPSGGEPVLPPPAPPKSSTETTSRSELSISQTQSLPPVRRLSLHSYMTDPKLGPPSPGSVSSGSSASVYLFSPYTVTVTLATSSISISANYVVTLFREETDVVMTTPKHFRHFQALHSAIAKELPGLGINSSFFPKTYSKSSFGISLTADQKSRRVKLLSSWLSRVLLASHSLLPASQSLLHKFLLPPSNLEMLSARKIQSFLKAKRLEELSKCAIEVQRVVRGRRGRVCAVDRHRRLQAMLIQAHVRGRKGRAYTERFRDRVEAAVMIQKIARKNRDVQRFFKFAKEQ
ncbi:hypothetical protein TrRE_jg8904, partial [Triparma retinervis]